MALPVATPVTTPELLTVATEVLLLLHVPPLTLSVNEVILPTDTVEVPVIVPADGAAFTITEAVALAVPQLLVTA